jgi:hypothetical protein
MSARMAGYIDRLIERAGGPPSGGLATTGIRTPALDEPFEREAPAEFPSPGAAPASIRNETVAATPAAPGAVVVHQVAMATTADTPPRPWIAPIPTALPASAAPAMSPTLAPILEPEPTPPPAVAAPRENVPPPAPPEPVTPGLISPTAPAPAPRWLTAPGLIADTLPQRASPAGPPASATAPSPMPAPSVRPPAAPRATTPPPAQPLAPSTVDVPPPPDAGPSLSIGRVVVEVLPAPPRAAPAPVTVRAPAAPAAPASASVFHRGFGLGQE